MKKVSVIIPMYNVEEYISTCIESVIGQTYNNIEVLIIDDGSTDNSLEIAKCYESKKIKIFTQSNSGASRARNLGFDYSTGDYIQYLDADDLLANNKIEEQVKILEDNGANCLTFCSHTRNYIDFKNGVTTDEPINKWYSNPLELLVDIYNGNGNIITHCWLTRRSTIEKIGRWDERLVKNQDGEFFARAIMASENIIFSSDTLVFYRNRTDSITRNTNINALKSVLLATKLSQDRLLEEKSSNDIKSALIKKYSRIYCSYFCLEYKHVLQELHFRALNLGGSLYYVGNQKFNFLSKIIGLNSTLLLKNTFKKMVKFKSK